VTVLPDGKVDHELVYPATCSDYFQLTATVPVVAGPGTGAYRGIRGNFSFTLTGNEDQETPPCAPPFVRQILVLTGSGTVSSSGLTSGQQVTGPEISAPSALAGEGEGG
jgi:hypothetical protein